ncbi:MAG: F0F1 ATP synthase subunit epsilon [Paracoccaceae bacterium]|jgi:F-type H+-transporting ATPase subunit epsilon|nr:F0F1 ATP synthase subunit epsilon [Marinovum sp.]MBT4872613.1 F0F1 ATP synthase subunit epsilon [Marinovum sp.]MBT6098451.1 F0F1 ATP synthase subunit epsilon [Marinovum sp.]MDG1425024.1 F0F1 ATP synthase subunit epsilon [Paracoccaceae bacterium]MDG2231124.1 F0F1 ATP synthase subunit epsilon [Paracoccaceae bacterium]
MAQTMQFDLVSPERRLASGQVTSVQIPGVEGDLTAMPGHMPLITTLRPGVLRVSSEEGDQDYVVTGGFAEIGEGLSVLAEKAVLRSEMTEETFETMLKEAENFYGKAKETFENQPGPVDDAAKMLSDMVALGDDIGLGGSR